MDEAHMTPPKIPSNDLSFLDWAPGQDKAPAVPTDPNNCSNCHTGPSPKRGYALNEPSPFFLDYTKKPKAPLNAQDEALLRAWLAADKAPDKPAANPPPAVAAPTPVKPPVP